MAENTRGPKKTKKATSNLPKGRTRHKNSTTKTLAVAVYPKEQERLDYALERQKKMGSRATFSSCVRWAINVADWDEMPPLY